MDLYIIFDEQDLRKIDSIKKNNHYTILTFPHLITCCKKYTDHIIEIIPLNFNQKKELTVRFTTQFYSSLEQHADFKTHIEPHINSLMLYSVWNIFSVLVHLTELQRTKKYHRIFIFGGNRNVCFFSIYGAKNREDKISMFFKSSWIYNFFIYDNFKNSKEFVFVEEDAIKIQLIKHIRRFTILFGGFLITLIKHFRMALLSDRCRANVSESSSNTIVVFPVRSIHQLRTILPLTEALKTQNVEPFIIFYEMLFGKGVLDYIEKYYNNSVAISLFKVSYIKYILKSFKSNLYKYLKNNFKASSLISIRWDNMLISIPLKELISEFYLFCYSQSYLEMLTQSLKKLKELNLSDIVVLSSEQIDKNAFFERLASKNVNLAFYNMQTGLFNITPYPVVSVGKIFFLSTYKNYKAYRNLGCRNKGEVAYIGPLKYLGIIPTSIKKKFLDMEIPKNILYITQPQEDKCEIDILKLIFNWRINFHKPIHITIKLHPRDTYANYDKFLFFNNYSIYQNDRELYDLIRESDLVIGRVSSVLEESLLIGVPYLVCLFSIFDQSLQSDIFNKDSYLVCSSAKELHEKLSNYGKLIKYFNKYRKKYLYSQKIPNQSQTLQNFLTKVGIQEVL